MKLIFSETAWADYQFWIANDLSALRKINELVRDASRTPFTGIGKPEPLSGKLKGWWSRRISREHRLVYRVTGTGQMQALEIASCRFRYEP